ncbi:hypothetical protein AB3S75_034696 [Citrus x aurantiifolia]
MATTEPVLSIQTFHQSSSFVSIKLNTTNYLLWRSQVLPLIKGIGILHHFEKSNKPPCEIDYAGKTPSSSKVGVWDDNDIMG